jgi:hypothetical protein
MLNVCTGCIFLRIRFFVVPKITEDKLAAEIYSKYYDCLVKIKAGQNFNKRGWTAVWRQL